MEHSLAFAPPSREELESLGQVFTAARTQLGMKNAKMLIAICANDRASNNESKDFEVALNVVEDLAKDG
jgi:hypothetical protein